MAWLPKKRVVAPTDLSELSRQAYRVALEMVDNPDQVHVVHVLPTLSPMEPGVVWGDVDDNSRRAHAEKAVRKFLEPERADGAHVEILFGSPAMRIADYASKAEAEMIVLPSHGRTDAIHVLIGSTAERVVRYAHCPVLVLRK